MGCLLTLKRISDPTTTIQVKLVDGGEQKTANTYLSTYIVDGKVEETIFVADPSVTGPARGQARLDWDSEFLKQFDADISHVVKAGPCADTIP